MVDRCLAATDTVIERRNHFYTSISMLLAPPYKRHLNGGAEATTQRVLCIVVGGVHFSISIFSRFSRIHIVRKLIGEDTNRFTQHPLLAPVHAHWCKTKQANMLSRVIGTKRTLKGLGLGTNFSKKRCLHATHTKRTPREHTHTKCIFSVLFDRTVHDRFNRDCWFKSRLANLCG